MENTYALYLKDLISLITENANEIKKSLPKNKKSNSGYDSGKAMAYYEIISLIKSQAEAFDLDLKEIGLDNLDPDDFF